MPSNDDYGMKVEKALYAVQQMHQDVAKLILLLDKKLDRKPVLSRITDEWKFGVNAGLWMPEGMHRLYAVPNAPGRVEGITVAFINLYGEPIDQPLLLVGQAEFGCGAELKSTLTDADNLWCLWNAYLVWREERTLNQLQRVQPPADRDKSRGALKWVRVIAIPLYSVNAIEDVLKLLERTRENTSTVPSARG